MGPTNIALVKLFEADRRLREGQGRLDAALHDVRIQERRVRDLNEKLQTVQTALREKQAEAANLELDLKSRDAHIEKLRKQQENAKNNKEYQAFLVEINTEKLDRGKVEDQTINAMGQVEKLQGETRDLTTLLEAERGKLQAMSEQIEQRVAALKAEIAQLQPQRDTAADAVPPKARDAFERLAERFEGEALAPLGKPDRRREEYICGGCHMSLVTDVYNRLHSRDELVFCPSCRRILYIPDELPVETAVHRKKEPKPRKTRAAKEQAAAGGAAINRQSSAADVLESMRPDTADEAANSDSQTNSSEAP